MLFRSSETKAKKLQAKADAEGELSDTTSTMEADKKYLADTTATCEQKAADFESRQQLRAEELEAIAKAIEIISSGAVAGNADKHLPALVQKGKALAMLRSDSKQIVQAKVAQFLQDRAGQLNSRVLSALAVRVTADGLVRADRREEVHGALELVDAGDEVRLLLLEVRLLLLAEGRGLLPGSLVLGHVRFELGNFLRKLRVLGTQIFQLRLSSFDCGRCFCDGLGLLLRRGVAVALELRVHSAIVGSVLLALVEHFLQQLHHFRDG